MNHDKMSVEELLPLYNWNIINATLGKITEAVASHKGFELFTAIKKAVIREASVGVGTVRRAGDAPLPEAPQMFVPWETKDGDYDLILKAAP